MKEFDRQGIHDSDGKINPLCYLKYIDNSDGNFCSTYPSLLVVPSKVPEREISKTAKFRTRERIPILSYAFKHYHNHKIKFTYLWRCSQCKVILH